MTERYLVPATLTDEQCDALEEALSEAEDIRDPFDKWLVICRAIGTPVSAGSQQRVGRTDRERLDWLETFILMALVKGPAPVPLAKKLDEVFTKTGGISFRDAIDAAMDREELRNG